MNDVLNIKIDDLQIQNTFTSFFNDYENIINEIKNLGYYVTVYSVTLKNYKNILNIIPKNTKIFCVCDGTETDGYPGHSIFKYLEIGGWSIITSSSEFMINTIDKGNMKKLFLQHDVSTSNYIIITVMTNWNDINNLLDENNVNFPLFVKPSNSYGSNGITNENIIKNDDGKGIYKLILLCKLLLTKFQSLIIENFLDGEEYTVSLIGYKIMSIVQKYFKNPDISFQTYNDVWSNSENNKYKLVKDKNLEKNIIKVCLKAYKAVNGFGIARIDVRTDKKGKIYILEVNSCCSLGPSSSFNKSIEIMGYKFSEALMNILSNNQK